MYVCFYASSNQTLGLATYLSRLTELEMHRAFVLVIHLQEFRLKYIVVRPSGFLEERGFTLTPLFFVPTRQKSHAMLLPFRMG